MWVLIDNYDSFTHILHHYLLQAGAACSVFKNDEITVQQLAEIRPARLIISPGPETPLQTGITMEVIRHFHAHVPILGVCLGHQALGMFFGAKLVHAQQPMHGKTDLIAHSAHPLFAGISNPFEAMRYHSLLLENLENTGLQTIAFSQKTGEIMALAHPHFPCIGVQFHPESIGTESGLRMIENWKKLY